MSGAGGIAIVGMACRYPDADGPAQLWQTVLGRRRAFRAIPPQRLAPGYFAGRDDPLTTDRTYVTHAGLLRGWEFDRRRFGVPGPLHRAADHTHWLALQTAAEALADAGFPDGDGLDRDRVGVLLGNSLTGEFSRASMLRLRWPFLASATANALAGAGLSDEVAAGVLAAVEDAVKRPFPEPGDESLAGALANTIAGRVCNHFDFHGTGYTVDGACASSLLAVMTAARYLLTGELSFALAGGVDLSLDPLELVGFARVGALAVDEMRVYDAEPTGFLPGEGCGVVALMRTEDAARLGLRSYATLLGWGMSSDGAGGITRPEVAGQRRALSRAYARADCDPAEVGLVEGHGTGTEVGDLVELTALTELLRGKAKPAVLGTVKANIGHTKAAAGIAGLLKATLAVHHRVLPPTTGSRRPHPILGEPGAPLRLASEPEPWTGERPVAGVSSFGFGGINTHVVLAGPAGRAARPLPMSVRRWAKPLPADEIVFIGATGKAELAERLTAIAGQAGALSRAELHDLAATLADRTGPGPWRAALVAGSPERLRAAAESAVRAIAAWDGALALDERAGWALGSGAPGRVGLLFPGQAAPVRDALPGWAAELPVPPRPAVPAGGPNDTAVAQPAIVRQSLAGLAWLDAVGCRPVGAAGHSLGELTALVWSGALSATDGLELAVLRGWLMAEHGAPDTTMAMVAAPADVVRTLVEGTGATISGYNSPTRTTIAGPVIAVDAALARAAEWRISALPLPVSHGFHSAAMTQVIDPLRATLAKIHIGRPIRPIESTITGRSLEPGADLAGLLVRQLTEPVRFTAAVTALAGRCDLLVEVGPGRTLSGPAAECAPGVPVCGLDCGGDPRQHAFATAALSVAAAADLTAWFGGRAYRTLTPDEPITLLANPCETDPPRTQPTRRAEPVTRRETGPDGDPLEVYRDYLADLLELPTDDIRPDSSLLGDLHLNSLQVVHSVSAVADTLGRRTAEALPSLVNATVRDVADVLAALPAGERADAGDEVAGIAPWVRVFAADWTPSPIPVLAEPISWTVDAPGRHWTHHAFRANRTGLPGRVVVLADDAGPDRVADILRTAGTTGTGRFLLLHQGHPAAEGIARSVAIEVPDCAVTVARLRPGQEEFATERVAGSGYRELRARSDGEMEEPAMRVRPAGDPAPIPLRAGEVCLVTGGAAGITAYSAAALAQRTRCKLVVLGRSPADAPAVRAGMGRLPASAEYRRCDLTDPAAVRAALAGLGPVRGLLHGAGVNVPSRLEAVRPESLRATLAPKVTGLANLLAVVGEQLSLAVCFGSIIGRRGMTGQAEYCVANDWMRAEFESWSAAHPDCRAHVIEWSLWSELGMGTRLDVVESLRRQGVTPIVPEAGARALLGLLSTVDAPVTVLITSRFPAGPTLAVAGSEVPPLRFAERVRAHTPGVEAVVDAELAPGADLALDEHRIGEVAVLPAVLGLEAMAQAAVLVAGRRPAWTFERVRLDTPVTVPDGAARTIRVAAQAEAGTVELALRDDADRFAGNRFTARLAPASPATKYYQPPEPPRFDPARPHPWYGPLMFHSGRFRRLIGFRELSAFALSAWIQADPASRWLSQVNKRELLLGDPGAHDATIHVLMACVPHRRVLPIGIDQLTVLRRPNGPVVVRASEREHTADEYLFDVDADQADGRPVARWRGLRLRAVGPLAWLRPLPARLAGPWLSRRMIECGFADRIELTGGSLATADPAVGVAQRIARQRPDALGALGGFAGVLVDKASEDRVVAANRVDAARAAAGKLGIELTEPRIEQITEDGLIIASTERLRVITAALATDLAPDPAVVAIALTKED